ncbi:MAG: GNAT family N-acetyltransferase [Anaerolineae bacterium]
MQIRRAILGDADRFRHLDSSYQTNCVWHIVEKKVDARIEVVLERTRLPRTIDVLYPCGLVDLTDECRTSECFIVADQMTQVMGCLDLRVRRWSLTGWVEYMLVDRSYRGQGVGSKLLESAEIWAHSARVKQVTIPVQTKNDTAISFCLKRGYRYSGYIDRYFSNDDIGLLYTKLI